MPCASDSAEAARCKVNVYRRRSTSRAHRWKKGKKTPKEDETEEKDWKTKQRKTISYGRFLKTEKKYPKLFFLWAFTCFTPGVEPNWARASKVLAIPWWEVSRPVLLFSRGIGRTFDGVAAFGEKNQQEISSYISRFHPKMGPCFSNNQETGVCRQFFKTTSWRNGKRRWMPRPKWLRGASSRSIFSPSPIARAKPRAGVLFSRLPMPLSTRLVCTCSTSYPVTCILHTATIPFISTLLIKITSTSSRPPISKPWTFLVCRLTCETSNIIIWQCGQGVLTSSRA